MTNPPTDSMNPLELVTIACLWRNQVSLLVLSLGVAMTCHGLAAILTMRA
jgi:hypothetical protein